MVCAGAPMSVRRQSIFNTIRLTVL